MKNTQPYLFFSLWLAGSLPASAHSNTSLTVANHLSGHMFEAGVIFVGLLVFSYGLRRYFKK